MSSRGHNKIRIPVKAIVFVGFVILISIIIFILVLLNQSMLSKPVLQGFGSDTPHVYTGAGFMYSSGGTVLYDAVTAKDKSYTGKLPHPDMKLCGYGNNTHAVYDTSTLCIIGLDNAITPGGTIRSVECGNGFVACLYEHNGTEAITVYDLKGNIAEEITPQNTVALFGFSRTEKDRLYVVTVDTSSGTPVSTINTYDPSASAMTGIITVQDQLVESIIFTQRSIFVNATTNIIRYDISTGKESYRLIKHGFTIENHYVSGDTVYFVMTDGITKRIYTTSQSAVPSETVLPLQLGADTLCVFVSRGNIYAVTPTTIKLYKKTGEIKTEEALKYRADSVEVLKDNKILISSGKDTYVFTVAGTNAVREMFKK